MILSVVLSQPGISRSGIERITHAKPNSIRGTLWGLTQEGLVERRGKDAWFPTTKAIEASGGKSVRDTPEASEQEPQAQGGEARPGGGT